MFYDPNQVADAFHGDIENPSIPMTMAEHFYNVLHRLCLTHLYEHGDPPCFTLPAAKEVLPCIEHIDVRCLPISHTRAEDFGWDESDEVLYLVFDDLSFLAWDSEGPVDQALIIDNSTDAFTFEDLANDAEEIKIHSPSQGFSNAVKSVEKWREMWGPAEARYPEDPESALCIYIEMHEEVHNVRDPFVDEYSSSEEWTHERVAEVEEEIFNVASALLAPDHRMEIIINSAPEYDQEGEIEVEHYGPKGATRSATLEIFSRVVSLHGLYGYQLEYSDSGDAERMSSHYKTGLQVAFLELNSDDISAHEHIEARTRLVPALVKTGLSEQQATDLLNAAHAGEEIPKGIKSKSS